MPLYHRDVFMPPLRLPGEVVVRYTRHALDEAKSEQERGLNLFGWLPRRLCLRAVTLVEASIDRGRLVKILVRYTLPGTGKDIVISLAPEGNTWYALTVWTNNTTDTHRTLNRTRYAAC